MERGPKGLIKLVFTHQMPTWSRARQQREQIYRTAPEKFVEPLRILAKSSRPLLREFAERWLQDYQLWLEHEAPERAA